MTCYLVTGGAGFIGANLVEELLRRGARVRVLDNLATGRAENLAPFRGDVEFIEGDLRDPACVRRAVAGVEIVLHQAALPSVPRSVADPLTSNEVNVTGTVQLLVAARDAGVRRVVAASSSSVYGNSPTLPKVETMPTEPLSPYAVSKLATERYCQAFTQVYGLPTIALRYFNVFGPRQDPTSQYSAVIPKFIALLLRGESPLIHGDGRQSRDFTYVDNVVAANLLAAEAPPEVSGYFNVACGDRVSLLDLVARLNALLGTAIPARHGPPRPGDVRDSQADIGTIRRLLGYEPVVGFDEGLARTLAYFRRPVAPAQAA
ncbi:MAG TPA: SDR family oxidoreductase [Thermomicrobiales bacterium]|nr:SDR family oxidoreductase [Thermomicrobiales bacterium]